MGLFSKIMAANPLSSIKKAVGVAKTLVQKVGQGGLVRAVRTTSTPKTILKSAVQKSGGIQKLYTPIAATTKSALPMAKVASMVSVATKTSKKGMNIPSNQGVLGKVGGMIKEHPVISAVAGTALAAGAVYAGEQIAEKAGVRGGAGFFGSRKKRGKKKYAYLRVRRNVYGKGELTKQEETSLRSLARRYSLSGGTSRSRRKSRRSGKYVSFTTKSGKKVRFKAR